MYDTLIAKLGADPLREDADPQMLLKACASSKPIATVLVDQAVCAGIGNIYRSEILYEAGIHPKQAANTLQEAEILRLWNVAVKQMQAGFKTGSIWGTKNGSFCYGKKTSAAGGKVKQLNMGGRAVYFCTKRQTLESKRVPIPSTKLRRSGTEHLDEMVSAVKAPTEKSFGGSVFVFFWKLNWVLDGCWFSWMQLPMKFPWFWCSIWVLEPVWWRIQDIPE